MNTELVSISLTSGVRLAGTYLPGTGAPDFAVVWVHGFGSHRGGEKAEAVRAECSRRGWAFAAFDFRGHGETGGAMHELRASRLLEDLAAVRDFLAERGHTRLGPVGSSMGGFASAWFTKQNAGRVVGCVLLAPAFGFLDRRWNGLTSGEREEWRRTDRRRVKNDWVDVEIGYGLVEERERFAPDDLVRDWQTPALLFHGLADDTVPDSDSLFFIRHVDYPRVELRLLKDGDHRLTAHKDTIAAAAGEFFAGLLGSR
ncbi:MAG: alpha/beta fold hydrolase [Planctomycetes bacterium]|nr:alpha/beta fold hydrolase [Planctomycetota bacterium]